METPGVVKCSLCDAWQGASNLQSDVSALGEQLEDWRRTAASYKNAEADLNKVAMEQRKQEQKEQIWKLQKQIREKEQIWELQKQIRELQLQVGTQ